MDRDYQIGDRVWLYYGNAWNLGWHRATVVGKNRNELMVRPDNLDVINNALDRLAWAARVASETRAVFLTNPARRSSQRRRLAGCWC